MKVRDKRREEGKLERGKGRWVGGRREWRNEWRKNRTYQYSLPGLQYHAAMYLEKKRGKKERE